VRAADDDDDFTLATTTRTRKKKDTDDQVKVAKRESYEPCPKGRHHTHDMTQTSVDDKVSICTSRACNSSCDTSCGT
jgi:hypothetical protein